MDIFLKKILSKSKTIAVLGASRNKNKDSYKVMKYLKSHGYKVLPINPHSKDEIFLGERYYQSLKDIEISIDILNIFRPSSESLDISKISILKEVGTVWMQLGITCDKCKSLLAVNNINFIQNKCIQIEHKRIFN